MNAMKVYNIRNSLLKQKRGLQNIIAWPSASKILGNKRYSENKVHMNDRDVIIIIIIVLNNTYQDIVLCHDRVIIWF